MRFNLGIGYDSNGKMKFYILILACVIIIGCEKRKDYYIQFNEAPELSIDGNNEELTDSIKLGFTKKIDFLITDEYNLKLDHRIISGDVDVTINQGENFVIITPNNIGNSIVEFIVIDPYKEQTIINYNLVSFDNLEPVPVLKVDTIPNGFAPYEIEANASASFDQDSNWDGNIVEYNFKIGNNYDIKTPNPIIRYIFASPGQKTVSVRVKDNDGLWSDFTQKFVVVK